MEDLLLVLDEIDDVFSMIASKWHSIVSFLAAVALFLFTGFVFLTMPMTAIALAAGLIGWGTYEYVRERRVAARAH
jgi:Flp pilus assembly protein protease CpaA